MNDVVRYKCDLGHIVPNEVVSLCDSCLVAMKNQRNALLEFVKDHAHLDHDEEDLNIDSETGYLAIMCQRLLKEIGELSE